MSEGMKNNLYKPCNSCGEQVHSRSTVCKKCGASSPWAARPDAVVKQVVPEASTSSKPHDPVKSSSEMEPHIALRTFTQIVGDVTVYVKKDRILTDSNLIRRLLAQKSPIVPASSAGGFNVCPNCHHIYEKGSGNAA